MSAARDWAIANRREQVVGAMSERAEAVRTCNAILAAILLELGLELIMFAINRSSSSRYIKLFFINNGEYFHILTWAAVAILSSPLGTKRFLTCALAFALVTYSNFQFRGPWVWDGTFDHSDLSYRKWLISGLVGLTVGTAFSWKWQPALRDERLLSTIFISLFILMISTVVLSGLLPVDSADPSTKPLFVATGLTAATILLWAKREA